MGGASDLARLRELLARVERRRSPHLVTVVGEAGIGKSRLLAALEEELAAHPSPPLVRRGRCLPYGSNVVYWPLGEVIRAECGIVDGDPPELAWEKLSARVGQLLDASSQESRDATTKAAVIGRLLGIDPGVAEVP